MENLETNTSPLGEAGATASQGQLGGNETQPSGTEAGTSDTQLGNEGQAPNPWDNDPKFKGKTSDDIYKAYKEAEKLTGQLSQKAQIANLIEKNYGIPPEELQARIEQQEQQSRQQYYANNPLAPVLDEVKQLRQVVEQQEQEKALANEEKQLDKFLAENPDYAPHRDKLKTLALTKGIGFDDDWEKSYDDIAKEWIGDVRAQGQNDAYKKIEIKKQTQTTGTSTTRPSKGGYSSLQDLTRSERIKAFEQIMGA